MKLSCEPSGVGLCPLLYTIRDATGQEQKAAYDKQKRRLGSPRGSCGVVKS